MLGLAYQWIDSSEGSFLRFNAGCVARVKKVSPDAKGRAAEVSIDHFGQRAHGLAGSVQQGKRFVEAWIVGQGRRKWRGPQRRSGIPVAPPRQRTQAEIREWQERQAALSARMMAESGWRPLPRSRA